MKGAVWEFWIFGTVAAFIAILLFFTFTPFITTLTDNADTIGNFSTATINTSFHNMLDRNLNLWNLWPIAIIAIVFFLFFIAASDEDEFKRGRL